MPGESASASLNAAVTRLLIVDMNRTARRYLIGLARRAGYVVEEAEDGATALQLIRAGRVDVLMTGFELPDTTGIDLCWHFKAEITERPTFAVVMTAPGDARYAAEALDGGADDCLRMPVDAAEFLARLRIAVRLLGMQRRMFSAAWYDALTGCYNRRRFFELAERELMRMRRDGRAACVIMMDIDFFKKINDTHGHEAGDTALQTVASVFRRHLRQTDILGRLGGEEFVVMLPDADLRYGMTVAERLRVALAAEEVILESATLRITGSFGVAQTQVGEVQLSLPLRRADALVYTAKGAGRNRVCGPDTLALSAFASG